MVLVIWQFGVSLFHIPKYEVSTPTLILQTYESNWRLIWYNFELTLFEAVAGMLIGTVVGYGLGVALGYSRLLEKATLPYVVAATTIPVVAIVPILLVVLGEGAASKIAVTAFITFFPLTLNTLRGMRAAPRSSVELFRVMAASRRHTFLKLRAPAALPYVFVGLRLAAAGAAVGAIVAEFIGSQRGLGYLLLNASYDLDTPLLWSVMIAAAALGVGLFVFILILERIFLVWHE
ncbi:MAG: ABC transporter permease [Acidimicrobiales bacterium]